jgi:hypothetical protein
MYINFKMLESKGLSYSDLVLLQASKQNRVEALSAVIEKFSDLDIEPLKERGYLTHIAGKKKDSEASKLRLTKKGVTLLEILETPEVTEEDLMLYDWMADVYVNLGKEIGNKKKTKMYVALFRAHSGIEKNCLATLLDLFVKDEDNMEYNHKLEYAFFKPATVYQVKFELEQSRLYQYYLSYKSFFDNKFEELNKIASV